MDIISFFQITNKHSRDNIGNGRGPSVPLRAEIFGIDRLEEHAKELAHAQKEDLKYTSKYSLLKRLSENEQVLRMAQEEFTKDARDEHSVFPAAEWLLDNYYLVQEQIHEVRKNLSEQYYEELVKLRSGPYADLPRIYSLAVELIIHTDSRLHVDVLTRFMQAYQTVAPLSSGEIWAYAIMLRVGLIENLCRLMNQSLAQLEERQRADTWADQILLLRSRPVTELFVLLADLSRQASDFQSTFYLQLMQRLRDQDPAIAPAIRWIEERMIAMNVDLETIVRNENQNRATTRVSVGNAITSLRMLSVLNWQDIFESTSLVERVLREDPSGVYPKMDFTTRDSYRHSIEKLSKQSGAGEFEIARRAVELARTQMKEASHNVDPRLIHVGYYLVDEGIQELEPRIRYHPSLHERWTRWFLDHAAIFYLSLVTVLTVLFVLGIVVYAEFQSANLAQLVLTVLISLLPLSVFSIGMVNWSITLELAPRPLPKLEFKNETPKEYRTMIVVPALLSSLSGIDYLCHHQELRYLANRDACLHFALLTDFADAPEQHMPEDEVLLAQAQRNIQELNEKYGDGRNDRFYLFHRQRRWNPVAQIWMGWERKRGKLIEFNRLLRGATDTSYAVRIGDLSLLPQIKYLITLDADTELPLNAARRLVGALAHPLNRAVIEPKSHRVVKGYGIIQPGVEVTAEAAAQSWFAQLLTGDAGLDPYSSVTSDVYQDMFQASIYIGKAIYDVDAMLAAVGNRFPENLLLSHDLVEGAFARAGLASDILLLEDFPSGYDAFIQRQHRWIRGDWQITQWLFPHVPDASGRRVPNPLPVIERWKIFDNLRRSLLPPALIALSVAGWTVLPGSPIFWTCLVASVIVFPLVPNIISSVRVHPPGEPWRSYFSALGLTLARSGQRALLLLTMQLFQATQNIDAILHAFTRRMFNRRKLLQWNSAATVERGQAQTLGEYWSRMWIASVLVIAISMLLIFTPMSSIVSVLPFLLLWFISPFAAYELSQPMDSSPPELPKENRAELEDYARRIWRFYEDFAGEADHWLPPDNYQVTPKPIVAHRTSPTNIAFLLLSTLSAYDLEFINGEDLAERLDHTITTIEQLERYRGHLYNWYDTLTLRPLSPEYVSTVDSGNLAASLIVVKQACLEVAPKAVVNAARFHALADRVNTLLYAIDFRFLFNETRAIFSIGYNVVNDRLDDSYYDLLASEARIASFIAIALRQIPERHWFFLNRPLTHAAGRVALLSWGGTMFEYLMPTLLMRDFPHTLLYQTYLAAIKRQIEYGIQRGVPWGISESGFYAFDFQFNYQYRMFGVPDLGLKREVSDNLVISPYSTFLALPFLPQAAWQNLQALQREAPIGTYGFYEALDYTVTRRPKKERLAVVQSFMAHHQGMSLVALDNYLKGNLMRQRFHSEPVIAATELLLQERVPQHAPLLETRTEERPTTRPLLEIVAPDSRVYKTAHSPIPHACLLSNGEYTVMLTNAGGGYSAYKQIQATRWQEDTTRDSWGSFCYIRDLDSGLVWSATFQPTLREPEDYTVTFMPDRAEFKRLDADIQTQYEVAVSSDEDVEIRVITLKNYGSTARLLEVTSYAEVVLETHPADAAHPAFNKLFIESEFVPERGALLFKRRSRLADPVQHWALHTLVRDQLYTADIEYETDRARFIGRGRSLTNPIALTSELSRTDGAVLDPIMSLRCRVFIQPGETERIAFVTGITDSRKTAMQLLDKYSDLRVVESALDLSAVHNQILLQQINLGRDDAQLFQRLASRLIYPDASLRASPTILARNIKGLNGLWAYGISGDYPILIVRVHEPEELGLVRQVLLAHEYWRLQNFQADLVILNDHPSTYIEVFQRQIDDMVNTSLSHAWMDKPGGVFLRHTDHMPPEDQTLLLSAARVVLNGSMGGLAEQLNLTRWMNGNWRDKLSEPSRTPTAVESLPDGKANIQPNNVREKDRHRNPILRRTAARQEQAARKSAATPRVHSTSDQLFRNAIGGFSVDGKEYVITLDTDQWTPTPWSNVLANPNFGCLLTEAGLGYTWALNSQQNKLTPWSNDPVTDPSGEIIYLRDEQTRAFWTPTPLPIRESGTYTIRHGAGYSVYQHSSHDLSQELFVFVPKNDPVKIMRLIVRNTAHQARRLTAILYVEWVLGVIREQAEHYIITEHDTETDSLFARNPTNNEFNQPVAFAAANKNLADFTADRMEFLGRNGSAMDPLGLAQTDAWSGSAGAGLDPCAALQTFIELEAGEEKEIIFLIGQANDAAAARALVKEYRDPEKVRIALDQVNAQWNELLGAIQVKTPDAAMNVMLNRWLLYQALACRVWGRSAFYQSGGAYGFRDQLQDVLALVFAAPELAREHILRCAAHQFVEGDVQHWWHPPGDKGVRTKISDVALWLPFVAEHYITTTGDQSILDVSVRFLQAPLLLPDQREMYGQADIASEPGTLYEHCVRAIDHSLRFGEHGLPLMGTGDWNDGMSSVGDQGKGESVWLGWFLYTNLMAFARICQQHGDAQRVERYRHEADRLSHALEEAGWDGEWYRRAYFDDGTPLGSAKNEECKIDSIAQSWSIISNAGAPARRRASLQAVEKFLIREQDKLILLLTPPFDRSKPNPGYIQGYLPGIRENGGQYTHAALWLGLAHALEGNGDRAHELFQMINPISHSQTPEEMWRYKVEPYVVAADIYSHPAHLGRGGWTWYTGSAGWMYRIGIEAILGFRLHGNFFTIDPCIPHDWSHFELTYRHRQSHYAISVENPNSTSRGVSEIRLDDVLLKNNQVPLLQDGKSHQLKIVMG